MKKSKKQSKGLGDTVEKVIKATGLDKLVPDDCGCAERREKLNELLSFKLKVVNCPSDEVIKDYLSFNTKPTINDRERKALCKYYADTFNVPYYEPCLNCSPAPYKKMLTELNKVIN